MALRAPTQSRMTLETLATIKNPPIFAKQANIAGGHQQINNGSRAGDLETGQTKVLEVGNGERLDTERKARQAELIRKWKPWEQSTGPKSVEGKARVSQNGYREERARCCVNSRDCHERFE